MGKAVMTIKTEPAKPPKIRTPIPPGQVIAPKKGKGAKKQKHKKDYHNPKNWDSPFFLF